MAFACEMLGSRTMHATLARLSAARGRDPTRADDKKSLAHPHALEAEARSGILSRVWCSAQNQRVSTHRSIKILFVASACCNANAARALHRGEHGLSCWLCRRQTQHTPVASGAAAAHDHAVAAALLRTARRLRRRQASKPLSGGRLRARKKAGRKRLRRRQARASAHGRRGDPAGPRRWRRPAGPAPVRQVGVGGSARKVVAAPRTPASRDVCDDCGWRDCQCAHRKVVRVVRAPLPAGAACRVCFCGEEDEPLFQPCACRGESPTPTLLA